MRKTREVFRVPGTGQWTNQCSHDDEESGAGGGGNGGGDLDDDDDNADGSGGDSPFLSYQLFNMSTRGTIFISNSRIILVAVSLEFSAHNHTKTLAAINFYRVLIISLFHCQLYKRRKLSYIPIYILLG